MKSASAALVALLASDQFIMADLLTITAADGAVLRLTSADIDLVLGGNTFSSKGPYFQRTAINQKVGVKVDDLTVEFTADSTMTWQGMPFLQGCRQGFLDWATIRLERAFMAAWGDTSAGTVTLFAGRVTRVDVGRTKSTVTVSGITDLLNIQMPRNVWQAQCLNVLFDTNTCKAVKATFARTGTVSGTPTVNLIDTSLTEADSYFSQGTISFTSGALSGLTFTIKTYVQASGAIVPMTAFPEAPSPGDTFTAFPGCDHTLGPQGCPKFSNTANFRGMPYIPIPEMAY